MLKQWKITDADLRLKVKQMRLSECKIVPAGIDIEEVQKALFDYSAVYIHEADNPNKLIGAVTAFDLMQAF